MRMTIRVIRTQVFEMEFPDMPDAWRNKEAYEFTYDPETVAKIIAEGEIIKSETYADLYKARWPETTPE